MMSTSLMEHTARCERKRNGVELELFQTISINVEAVQLTKENVEAVAEWLNAASYTVTTARYERTWEVYFDVVTDQLVAREGWYITKYPLDTSVSPLQFDVFTEEAFAKSFRKVLF